MTDTYTPVLTPEQIIEIARTLNWQTQYDEVLENAVELARAIERAAIEAYQRRFERATVPENSQDWARLDGAVAWHLIERHADGWADVERMMGEFVAAKIEACQRQQWISVEDRLPDIIEWSPGSVAGISDPVLVYLDSEGESGSRMEAWSLRRGGRGDRTSLYWDWDSPKVTHWMPLPPAPDLPTATVDNLVENPMTDLRQRGLERVEKTLSGDEP